MEKKNCILIGVPLDCGKSTQGCLMGPDSYRTARIVEIINDLGHDVEDFGNIQPLRVKYASSNIHNIFKFDENIAWIEALAKVAEDQMAKGFPIFLGGDHALSSGTVSGISAHAAKKNKPLFVLWLDAHADFHTPQSTVSGNLHGTPVAYFTGQSGFECFPPLVAPVPTENVAMIGLRSVDYHEKKALQNLSVSISDMRHIDEFGVKKPLISFLNRVKVANGFLHVSLDVDFLDPAVAPAVGTTVPGGATIREAHLVMELLYESGLMTSLDLVELNPFLDIYGRTAQLMVDLLASGLGRRVFDRPNRDLV